MSEVGRPHTVTTINPKEEPVPPKVTPVPVTEPVPEKVPAGK